MCPFFKSDKFVTKSYFCTYRPFPLWSKATMLSEVPFCLLKRIILPAKRIISPKIAFTCFGPTVFVTFSLSGLYFAHDYPYE